MQSTKSRMNDLSFVEEITTQAKDIELQLMVFMALHPKFKKQAKLAIGLLFDAAQKEIDRRLSRCFNE